MSWYSRAWLGITSPVLRLIGAAPVKTISLGADYAAYLPAVTMYDQRLSEQATAKFPWLAASLPRKAGDLARLPWQITTGGIGKRGRPVADHPMAAILERPNSSEPGSLFWRQVYSELWKTGEAYGIKVRDARGRWSGLIWCPSARMDPIVGPSGFPVSYRNRGADVVYDARDIMHWRLPGSSDGPDRISGTGAIEPLAQTLDAEWRLKARLSQASRQGRPSALATPGSDLGVLGKDKIDAIRQDLAVTFAQSSGGIAIIGQKLDIEPLDWSPVDLDAKEQLDRARTEQLAVSGVPPVRVGLETANFATAEMQEIVYWGDELQGDSALIDDVLTMHARTEFGPADLYVYRDFSGVPVLQKVRDQALARVAQHIANGVDAVEAYRVEGLDDVRVAPAKPVAEPTPAAEAPRANVIPMRSSAWWGDDVVSRRGDALHSRSDDKAWRAWLARAHTPNEIRLRREMGGVLRVQAQDVIDAVGKLKPANQRDFLGDLIDAMMGEADAEYWGGVIRVLRSSIQTGIVEGAGQVSVDPVVDAQRLDTLTQHQLAELVTNTNATTRAGLRALLSPMIADGATVNEMQAAIQDSVLFSPMRALRIARTETTHALGSGTDYAYKQAVDAGAKIRQKWLTAGFEVRAAHQLLEGQTVDVGSPFVIPSGIYKGQTARFPGDFPLAALTVNCRCTTVAVDVES